MEELIQKRRSIRRFQQKPVSVENLEKYVDAARLAPSAANLQPLEYVIVHHKEQLASVFETLNWAGYIRPLGTPPENERPVAYIVVLLNTKIKKEKYEKDAGAAIENLILRALEDGVGSCWISSLDQERLAAVLNAPQDRIISDVLALGYPNEEPVSIEMTTGSVKYYKDEEGRLNVPKRSLKDILYYDGYQEESETEKAQEEEEIEWVRAFETSVEEEAEIIKGFLENHDIHCALEKSTFHEFPVNFSPLSRTNVLVPLDRQEEARRLVDERKLMMECPHCQEINFKGGLFCSHCWKRLSEKGD